MSIFLKNRSTLFIWECEEAALCYQLSGPGQQQLCPSRSAPGPPAYILGFSNKFNGFKSYLYLLIPELPSPALSWTSTLSAYSTLALGHLINLTDSDCVQNRVVPMHRHLLLLAAESSLLPLSQPGFHGLSDPHPTPQNQISSDCCPASSRAPFLD